MKALISVSDKAGIVELARSLVAMGIEIISTGGTETKLQAEGIKVTNISQVTGFPECLDGRVKTLHPKVHGGLLARRDIKEHMERIKELEIGLIDILVVNLYPFKDTVSKEGCTLDAAIENIDIGGPAMVRSAAKNFSHVSVVVDPSDYPLLIKELKTGTVSSETNFYFAVKAFQHTAAYDALIASYLREKAGLTGHPQQLTMTFELIDEMRYGENPHQKAAFYKEPLDVKGGLTEATQLHGKELSFNNINDANGALELLKEFDETTVVAVKHATPCGVGSGANIYDAFMKAYKADTVSIFGGIVAANREIDEKTAAEISKLFIEIVIAPSFSKVALDILKKKEDIRLLAMANIGKKVRDIGIKKVLGGLLIQDSDCCLLNDKEMKVVTEKAPTTEEMEDLIFALKLVKHVKSNGIAIAKNKQSVGLGSGQVSRIWACKQAIEHGYEMLGADSLKGAVMASDAFFPMEDCVIEAAKAGITAIVQPGGSKGDNKSINQCNEQGIAMIFTGVRHFKH